MPTVDALAQRAPAHRKINARRWAFRILILFAIVGIALLFAMLSFTIIQFHISSS